MQQWKKKKKTKNNREEDLPLMPTKYRIIPKDVPTLLSEENLYQEKQWKHWTGISYAEEVSWL